MTSGTYNYRTPQYNQLKISFLSNCIPSFSFLWEVHSIWRLNVVLGVLMLLCGMVSSTSTATEEV